MNTKITKLAKANNLKALLDIANTDQKNAEIRRDAELALAMAQNASAGLLQELYLIGVNENRDALINAVAGNPRAPANLLADKGSVFV